MIIKIKLSRTENINYYHQNIIEIDMEEYLKGVVASEIGNAPLEAGKAQAVAARTFALNKMNKQGYITDTSNDQAFRSSRLSGAYNKAYSAVENTAGEVLYYNNFLVTGAYYTHSNGGRTYSSEEVWGGKRDYLIARTDPWDKEKKSGHGIGLSQCGAKYAASIGKTYLEILNFYYPGTKIKKIQEDRKEVKTMDLKNTTFAEFLKTMVGQPYWFGTCVYNCTSSLLASKTKQYPSHYTSSRMSKYKKNIADKMVCADCIGLAKGFVWTNGGTGVKEAIGTGQTISKEYASNGCPDKTADGMFAYAKAKKKNYGTISTIPEVPGLAVRKSGHVGYYVGNGEVVEAHSFAKGIIITKLKERGWTDWYEVPGIEYAIPAQEQKIVYATIRQGSKGAQVKELQELLLSLEYDVGKTGADGIFGKATLEAVKNFQEDKKLKVDGIVGKATWAALGIS